jgi:hypothetical protein
MLLAVIYGLYTFTRAISAAAANEAVANANRVLRAEHVVGLVPERWLNPSNKTAATDLSGDARTCHCGRGSAEWRMPRAIAVGMIHNGTARVTGDPRSGDHWHKDGAPSEWNE